VGRWDAAAAELFRLTTKESGLVSDGLARRRCKASHQPGFALTSATMEARPHGWCPDSAWQISKRVAAACVQSARIFMASSNCSATCRRPEFQTASFKAVAPGVLPSPTDSRREKVGMIGKFLCRLAVSAAGAGANNRGASLKKRPG